MTVEVMIYLYGTVCVSMILFNISYHLFLKGSEPRVKRRHWKLKSEIDRQIALLQMEEKVEESHIDYLRRTLPRINNLIAFHQIIQESFENQSKWHQEYFKQIHPAIVHIAVAYRGKEDMQAAYFAYFLSCYTSERQFVSGILQEALLDYMKRPNLYCRFNALKALYHFASPEYLAEIMKILDDGRVFFHEKLLTEGLLSYTGDHSRLIASLWEQFSSYSVHIQLAVLNYIRFRTGDYKEQMYDIMYDKTMDKELRIAAIRYFGKYYYEPSKKLLLAFVQNKASEKWEYATVAATSLVVYPGKEVTEALKEALHSRNWYVRYSAARSLEHLEIDASDMLDIIDGNDCYAREMMKYRLELHRLQRKGEK